MGRHTAPAVEIELDTTRSLVLDLNALALFEEETGKNLMAMNESYQFTANDLRVLIWAAIQHEEESLSLQEVGSYIHFGNLEEISKLITKAFSNAMPTAKDDKAGKNKKRSVG